MYLLLPPDKECPVVNGKGVRCKRNTLLPDGNVLHYAYHLRMGGRCRGDYTLKCLVFDLQLIDLKWKLGMAVSSDSCKSLKSPYVTMTIKVADVMGHITARTFEMTVPQFQVCSWL